MEIFKLFSISSRVSTREKAKISSELAAVMTQYPQVFTFNARKKKNENKNRYIWNIQEIKF